MSRSGYSEDYSSWSMIMWRGAVTRAIRGKRGQQFLREMAAALDDMPEKKLVADSLVENSGAVCAIGSVGKARGVDMSAVDPEDWEAVAKTFGISAALVREIVWENDECSYNRETEEQRYVRMRRWVDAHIAPANEVKS